MGFRRRSVHMIFVHNFGVPNPPPPGHLVFRGDDATHEVMQTRPNQNLWWSTRSVAFPGESEVLGLLEGPKVNEDKILANEFVLKTSFSPEDPFH